MPDYFTYLGGTHTANSRAHCAFCVFDGILYTTFGRTSGDSSTNTLHADRLGDGMVTNDSSEMAESPVALALSDCSGLVIKDSNQNYRMQITVAAILMILLGLVPGLIIHLI
jgi:hypothetical protein